MEAKRFPLGCAEQQVHSEMDQPGVMTWQPVTTAQQPMDGDTTEMPWSLSFIRNESTDKTSSSSTHGCCSSVTLHQKVDSVMEENIRMRQSVSDMAFTMAQWMRGNKEQNVQVRLLVEKLKDSEQKRKTVCQELEAMKIQTKIRESEWEAERDRLATFQGNHREKNSKQVILKLQEDNWKLRKAHSRALVSRESCRLSFVE